MDSTYRDKRWDTIRKPQAGMFNFTSFPRVAQAFFEAFRDEGFNWTPDDINVEYDRTWLTDFRRMERKLRDNPYMINDNELPIIIDTAIQFYVRGWIQSKKDKHMLRREYEE